MAHSYTRLLYHSIFSTKDRQPMVDDKLKARLHPYTGGIIRELRGTAIAIDGMEDHVHILALLPAAKSVADVLRTVKTNSSGWVHKTWPQRTDFAWQIGYAGFTVSESNVEEVRRYLLNQKEHHRHMTFQEEYIAFLKRHGIEYDDRYIWD